MSEWKKFLAKDLEEFPEAQVSNSEKKQMKQRILGRAKHVSWLSKIAFAAVVFLAVSAMALAAFPSFASQIPILQNVVSFFEEEELSFDHFSDASQTLNLTQQSNGSTVLIEEAVYDGTSVTISFALKTTEDLGETPFPSGMIEAGGAGGYGAGVTMEKVDDTTYAGLMTMAPDFSNAPPSSLKMSWTPEAFENAEHKKTKLTGDWSFRFKLQALEGKKVKIDKTVPFEGGSYELDSLSLTKLSTVLRFDAKGIGDHLYAADWQLIDDLGNVYPMVFGTGGSTMFGRNYQQITFEAIDENAATVTIQPSTQADGQTAPVMVGIE